MKAIAEKKLHTEKKDEIRKPAQNWLLVQVQLMA